MWMIRRRGQSNDFWSEALNGWARRDEGYVYTEEEKSCKQLPHHGYWFKS